MKTAKTFVAISLVAIFTGCATYTPPPPLSNTGDPLIDGRVYIQQGEEKDRVMWQYRTGLAALRRGMEDEAKAHLDSAITSIGGILAGDEDAKRARQMTVAEDNKNFIGEPFERTMAYYYRGMLYWKDGEPDNARACYRSAVLADADAENKKYQADYVVPEYLTGFINTRYGSDGADQLKMASEVSRFDLPDPYPVDHNVIVFAEYGNGPIKWADGRYKEMLKFQEGPEGARSARLKVNGETVNLPPFDDLYFQATTRGGRVMDHVLKNKAVFKKNTGNVGNAALMSGLALAGSGGDTGAVGAGLAVAGLLFKGISGSTTPAADTRAWNNLPNHLSFGLLKLKPGQHKATVEFLAADTSVLGGLTEEVTIDVPAKGDAVVFLSDKLADPPAPAPVEVGPQAEGAAQATPTS